MKKYLPWILTGVFALWVLAALRPPRADTPLDVNGFARLPVLLNGRVQPFDSVARNSLLQIRTRQAYAEVTQPDAPWWKPGAKYTRLSAIEWLLELMTRPERADRRKVFRIDHPELRTLLGLPPEGVFYHSLEELRPHFEEIDKQARQAGAVESAQRTTFQKAVLKLFQNIVLYQRLKNTIQPEGVTNFLAELRAYQAALEPGLAAVAKHEAGEPHDEQALGELVRFARRYEMLSQAALPLIVPPIHPETDRDAWANTGTSLMESLVTRQIHPAVLAYAEMADAFAAGQAERFNQALARHQQWLAEKHLDREIAKGRWEFLYNHWRPFYLGTTLYVVVFLLGCVSWLAPAPAVWNRSGYGLLLLALAVHTAGILFRVALEGRPPVTNLYSSAVFVGWGAVALGAILERIHRDSVGLVMAATLGCITLIIAHNLALGGDTMEMMRAVLDSNFWLTTHVITITLGYSATFAAGFLAIVYVLRGLLTRGLGPAARATLNRMVYGILCFATLFSFVGTVLGGIWADQSWGRFWGWDPKENGALIIVLWNALILHARWGGLVGERGLMNLAIFGNIVTSFSWFGVNMLGVGLHSYGFMDAAFFWLMAFVASQLLLIGLGSLPLRYWASLRAEAPGRPVPAPAT
jgi:ABC-type transport system involved in cytochrome c biogenesis permease subunit